MAALTYNLKKNLKFITKKQKQKLELYVKFKQKHQLF